MERETTTYSTSARTRAIKAREVERKSELLKEGITQKRKEGAAARKEFYSEFNGSRKDDWRDWVTGIADQMQTAYQAGDMTEMARQHKRLTREKTSVRGEPKLDEVVVYAILYRYYTSEIDLWRLDLRETSLICIFYYLVK
jgi:hypothetical protein